MFATNNNCAITEISSYRLSVNYIDYSQKSYNQSIILSLYDGTIYGDR